MRVIKIGGNELDNPEFLAGLAAAVKDLAEPPVIVHGGGKAIADLQTKLGISREKVEGLRVTNAESMVVVQQVLIGQSNKTLVTALLAAGVDCIGLSGIDGQLLQCQKMQHPTADLGYVGEIINVRAELLQRILDMKIVPVVAPVSIGIEDLHPYNVNADSAAAAVAAALNAESLDFVSNVPGVLNAGAVEPNLDATRIQALIDTDVITDGMIPKVKAALGAVESGVNQARIVNLAGMNDLAAGTTIV